MKRLVAILTAIVLALTTAPVQTEAKTQNINDYLEASFDVDKVSIVKTTYEFNQAVDNNKIQYAIEEKFNGGVVGVTNTFTAKQDGCLLILPACDNDMLLYCMSLEIKDISQTKQKTIKSVGNVTMKYLMQIPVIAGHDYAIEKATHNTYKGTVGFYLAFIPQTATFNIDNVTRKTNKTIEVSIGNVYANGTELVVFAVPGEHDANEVLLNKVKYEYTATNKNGDAELILPEDGIYTLRLDTMLEEEKIATQVFVLDTSKYLSPTLDKLNTPYSALAGTNVIVGLAEPAATVYASYNGNEYSAKANRAGIYKIVLDEDLVEGKQIKLWQKKNKITSKKLSTRVTGE